MLPYKTWRRPFPDGSREAPRPPPCTGFTGFYDLFGPGGMISSLERLRGPPSRQHHASESPRFAQQGLLTACINSVGTRRSLVCSKHLPASRDVSPDINLLLPTRHLTRCPALPATSRSGACPSQGSRKIPKRFGICQLHSLIDAFFLFCHPNMRVSLLTSPFPFTDCSLAICSKKIRLKILPASSLQS